MKHSNTAVVAWGAAGTLVAVVFVTVYGLLNAFSSSDPDSDRYVNSRRMAYERWIPWQREVWEAEFYRALQLVPEAEDTPALRAVMRATIEESHAEEFFLYLDEEGVPRPSYAPQMP